MNPVKRVLTLLCIWILFSCSQKPDGIYTDGSPFFLNQLRGKWVIINYFASWCSSCIEELPELNRLYRNHKNRLVVIGVNFDGDINPDVQKFLNPFGIRFPLLVLFSPRKFHIEMPSVLPTTFVIDPEGNLYKILKGPQNEQSLLKITHLNDSSFTVQE